MNKYIKVLLGSALALLFGLAPAAVLAQDGGGEDGQPQQQQQQVQTETQASQEDGQTAVQYEHQQQGGEQARAEVRTREGEGESGTSTASEGESQTEDTGEIELDRQSIGLFEHATSTALEHAVQNPHVIATQGELQNFAASTLQNDQNISNVTLSSTTVSTDYSTKARFLGFIPASVPAHVEVSNDRTVNVNFPWWAFLFAINRNEIQSQAEQAVQTSLGATTTAQTGGAARFTRAQQATVLDNLISGLQSLFGAPAPAATSTQ